MLVSRCLAVFIVCLIFSSHLKSQSLWSYGPRAGLLVSSFSGEKHTQSVQGLSVGAFVIRKFGSSAGIEVNLMYAQPGGSRLSIVQNPPGLDIPIARQTITSQVILHSLELPVLFSYGFLSSESIKPRITIGPSLGTVLFANANRDITMEYNTVVYQPIPDPIFGQKQLVATTTDNENVTGEYERFNASLNTGVGLEIPSSRMRWFVDFRYRLGMSPVDIRYNPLNLLSNSSNLKSNSFNFSIALSFN